MSQEDAIDLTLVISDSDDDDDAPICLSSSNSTPRPAASPEPDIQVIESPVVNAVAGGSEERRMRKRVVSSAEQDALGTMLQLRPGAVGPNIENAEALRTASTPVSSPPKSTRPKPRRRARPSTSDEPDSMPSTSQPAPPSPQIPVVSTSQPTSTSHPLPEPTTVDNGEQTVPGKRIWKKKVRALDFSSTKELLNSVASASTPRRTGLADRPVVSTEIPVPDEAQTASGSLSKRRTPDFHYTEELRNPIASTSTPRPSGNADRIVNLQGTLAGDTGTGPTAKSQVRVGADEEESMEPMRDSNTPSASGQPRTKSSASQRTSSKAYRSWMDRLGSGNAGGRLQREGGMATAESRPTGWTRDADLAEESFLSDNTSVRPTSSSPEMLDLDDFMDGIAVPGPSRLSIRAKRNRQRTVESEATAEDHRMDIDSSPSIPTSRRVLPRAISIISSRQSSVLAEDSTRQTGLQGPEGDADLAGEQEVVITKQTPDNEDHFPEPPTASSEDFTILPASTTPRATCRNRQRSSPPVETPTASSSTPRKGDAPGAETEGDETISPIRRGTRDRKASEAMQTYVAQSGGPRFSKRLSQKSLPASVALRLPTPPPLALSRDVTPMAQDSPRFSKRLSQKASTASLPLRLPTPPPLETGDDGLISGKASTVPSAQVETPDLNAPSGFSLPTIPWHPPMPSTSHAPTQVKPADPNITSTRRTRKRPAEVKSNVPVTPTPVASTSQALHIQDTAVNDDTLLEDIPFPPCDEGENEFLKASDFADTKLMAAFAALDTSGNKAMSADEIAAVCMERGWLPKSLGVNAPACISNALRSYQRRIQSAASGPRQTLLARHMFFGGWSEAYLLHGLHPDNLKRLTESGIDRPRGSFWYLEGWYGSARWKSPFADLKSAEPAEEPEHPIAMGEVGTSQIATKRPTATQTQTPRTATKRSIATSEKQAETSRPAGKKSIGRPSRPSQADAETSSPIRPSRTAAVGSGLKLRLNMSNRESSRQQVTPQQQQVNSITRVRPRVSSVRSRDRSDSSDASSEIDEDSSLGASEVNSGPTFARRFDFYWNISTDTESDSGESSTSADSLSLHTQSDRQSVDVLLAGSVNKAKPGNNPTIHLSMSAGTGPAVFPDNPLGPVRWETASNATFEAFTFDDASLNDFSTGACGFDALEGQEADEVTGTNQSSRASSAFGSPTSALPWQSCHALYREPPDLDEDSETPSTSPESLAELPGDHMGAADAENILLLDDAEEDADGSLVLAVQTLGGLLPFDSGPAANPMRDSMSPVTRRSTSTIKIRRFRPVRIRGKDISKISLPSALSTSPASSPSTTSPFEVTSQTRSLWELSSNSPAKAGPPGDIQDYSDMVPGLQEQLSQIEIDCQQMCDFDEVASMSGVLNEVKTAYRLLFEKVNSVSDPLLLLGPGSSDLDELDDVWDTSNEPTSSSYNRISEQLQSPSAISSSAKACSLENPLVTPIEGKRNTAPSPHAALRKTAFGEAIPSLDQRMYIDEEDQIGIREVDDAILFAWAEADTMAKDLDEDCSMASEYGADSAMIIDDQVEDIEPSYETEIDEPMQIAVCPEVLGIAKPPDLQLPDTMPCAPIIGRSATMPLSDAWTQGKHPHQGSKAIPAGALRPRAMIECASSVKQRETASAPVGAPAESGSMSVDAAHSPNQRRRDRKALKTEDKLRTITVANIPAFALLYRGRTLLRRIDSDYINVTTLCCALRKPDLQAEFNGLPGTVQVTGNENAMANGFWVHLSLVSTKAEKLGMPEDLVRVLLNPDLVKQFPALLETLAAYRAATVKGLPRFGPPFGYDIGDMQVRASGTLATSTTASTPSRPANPPATPRAAAVQQQPTTTSVKRPSPQAAPSTGEPPSKRQKSTDALTVMKAAPVSSNRRPIIPVGVTTTQGATVNRSTARV